MILICKEFDHVFKMYTFLRWQTSHTKKVVLFYKLLKKSLEVFSSTTFVNILEYVHTVLYQCKAGVFIFTMSPNFKQSLASYYSPLLHAREHEEVTIRMCQNQDYFMFKRTTLLSVQRSFTLTNINFRAQNSFDFDTFALRPSHVLKKVAEHWKKWLLYKIWYHCKHEHISFSLKYNTEWTHQIFRTFCNWKKNPYFFWAVYYWNKAIVHLLRMSLK